MPLHVRDRPIDRSRQYRIVVADDDDVRTSSVRQCEVPIGTHAQPATRVDVAQPSVGEGCDELGRSIRARVVGDQHLDPLGFLVEGGAKRGAERLDSFARRNHDADERLILRQRYSRGSPRSRSEMTVGGRIGQGIASVGSSQRMPEALSGSYSAEMWY